MKKKILSVLAAMYFCGIIQAQENYVFHGKKDSAQALTFELLFQYSKECYNDSSLSHYQINLDNSSWMKVYSHKTATLDGFVIWLRKKYYR